MFCFTNIWLDICGKISIKLKVETMRKLLMLTVPLAFMLGSCLDNDNSVRYTDYITIDAGVLPDTSVVNATVHVPIRATAPNTCWHSIRFIHEVDSDTLYQYAALATFENHGETCEDVLVTKDSTFNFIPTELGSYVFAFYSVNEETVTDTIVVVSEK